ncbi:class I SAM-dependent methyltransferase [Lysobacter sp. cf310]|uniref:class I SAM-dependent methyltransferase n=1 Tax=Lysobacter sp. cf310 TaxID=1761790 RepID=UPI0008EA68A0|nr:class I SAM-dependent methyltransferase [Lysobacter sp. cf310]SFL32203.1 Methyltransferase domain-containing protein [Lysobacter sp. cf310]
MPDSPDSNRRTVAGYEQCAHDYAATVPKQPTGLYATALRQLVELLPGDGRVLDVGSGPGWDADFLETLGVRVHRTDVTAAFREVQAERGHRVDALDVLTDEIADTYDGILMLCVLQHFERADLDGVLDKLANALTAEGAVLLSYPLGETEYWEHANSGDYRVVLWTGEALDQRLRRAGFVVVWDAHQDESSGPWRSVLARKAA